jgi:S-formylglutathione hydrolase FrmB
MNIKIEIRMKKIFLCCVSLLLLAAATQAATADTLTIMSTAMHKGYRCVVITPDAYGKQKSEHFPVVYLLHGYGGNYANWITKVPAIKELADAYKCMIVCPDGNIGSWYIDSPVDSSWKFETYVGTEIPAYIDAHYRTLADRKHRAITGLSMGGHGALWLAFRHQDIFGAAGSMSGGVDIRPFPKKWDLAKRLGTLQDHLDNWNNYTVINQTTRLQNDSLAITIECGTSDFFINVNRNLHQQLLQQGIKHDYAERPGVHNWDYWSNAVLYQLLFFHRFFEGELK